MAEPVATDKPLGRFVEVRARYRRAMNLERDTERGDALIGYLITPIVRRALARIANSLRPGESERAWCLIGPYGSGKTAFAVFLSSLLGDLPLRRAAHRALREADPDLAQRLRRLTFRPIILTGERAPLDLLLVRALKHALDAEWSARRGPKPSILAEVARLGARLGRSTNGCSTSEILSCFERAAKCVHESTGAGLLLLVDEAGKTLEYAAQNPSRGDLQLYQALAELASASGEPAFVMLTVLHQAFEEYAARLSASQRNEWAKVQGRFSDLLFQEEPDQVLRLIAAALEPVQKRLRLRGWINLVQTVAGAVSQGTGWDRKALERNLDGCWPLHPVTAVLLGPLFRGKIAQNERSLFAFLSSGEPLGFHEFLASEALGTLYTPDRLYDYVMGALGASMFGRDGKLWAEIDGALRRLPPDAEPVDAKVVKTVGLLAMLGRHVGLDASAGVLTATASAGEDVSAALDRLQRSSLLVYRKFRDAYQLWEGSDLDVEELVKEARDQLAPEQSLASLLTRLVPPRPLVARRHLFHTGTLRYFDVGVVDGQTMEGHAEVIRAEAVKGGVDGALFYVLPTSDAERTQLRKNYAEGILGGQGVGRIPVVVAIPASTAYLSDLAFELAALERVQSTTAALQSDIVARKELTARARDVRQLLEQEVERVFSADNAECEWYTTKGRLPVRSSRDLMATLSDLFDIGYSEAPPIRNELLNRRELSSAAAKARRNLLEAMILNADKKRLGFSGYPPEVSMYRSVLEEPGIHRRVDGKWRFAPPDGSMRATWTAIEGFFEETERTRRPITELYERLRQPPFGIKDGPLPVLLCAALLCREAEVAVYEQGSLVPELSTPVLERMLKWPERFEVRQSRIAGIRLEVFERLARSLLSGGKANKTVLDVVRGLMRFLAALPRYAKNTAFLSADALRVRDALLRAREPAQLLFTDLPIACGCRPFEADVRGEEEEIERFLTTLRRALADLQNAHPRLMAQVQQALSQGFGLPTEGPLLRRELVARAKRVFPLAVEPLLRGFLVRASDEGLDHDDWLVSLATYLAAKPPGEWIDRDQDQFNVQLALVSRRFRSLEVMALADAAPEDGTRLVRVAVAQRGGIEQESVVVIREAEVPSVSRLQARIRAVVEKHYGKMPRDAIVAALALVTERLLSDQERAAAEAGT
jgi:hypothetical protein